MPKNIGYLTSSRSVDSDNVYTPPYVVHAISKYIRLGFDFILDSSPLIHEKTTIILCPFSKDEHAFPTVFRSLGYEVINSHYDPETGEGKDFFSYTKEEVMRMGVDYIIDNPPFSSKDRVLQHCEELDRPYALLLPIQTLQSIKRYNTVFSKGNTQALIFDKRIGYGTKTKTWEEMGMTNHFASIFICKDVLPQQLIFDKL